MSTNAVQYAAVTGTPIVELLSVGKQYKTDHGVRHALREVSLQVRSSTIQGVIGFSGAGKSTLLRCISHLDLPDTGQVLIEGEDLSRVSGKQLRTALRRIGVVFQHYDLLRSRTVAGNIALPLEIAGQPAHEIRRRVKELIGWFGLEDHAAHYPAQLSGGQQQRVAIARALASRPSVLLNDEPTSALDPETTAGVLELLLKVRDELGVTILLITHELSAVRAICDRVAVLEEGRIVEEGRVADVLLRPQSQAARRLIGEPVDFSHLDDYFDPQNRHHDAIFLRLLFRGPSATEPVLFEISQRWQVAVNILNAEIGRVENSVYGLLLVELRGAAQDLAAAQASLATSGVEVLTIDPYPTLSAQGGES